MSLHVRAIVEPESPGDVCIHYFHADGPLRYVVPADLWRRALAYLTRSNPEKWERTVTAR